MFDRFCVTFVDTFLNHCKLGCIVSRVGRPAKRASVIYSSLPCCQNAALAHPLHAAGVHHRVFLHGQFDWVEADRAPVPLGPFVAARQQPLFEIPCDRFCRVGGSRVCHSIRNVDAQAFLQPTVVAFSVPLGVPASLFFHVHAQLPGLPTGGSLPVLRRCRAFRAEPSTGVVLRLRREGT